MLRDARAPAAAIELGQPGAPAPSGGVAPGRALPLTITAVPGHPSNLVEVPVRVDGGLPRVLRAVPVASAVNPAAQRFVARLPALARGQQLEYRAELKRAGLVLAAAPADGRWASIHAAAAPAPPPERPAGSPFPAYDTAGTPRFGYGLDFLGALTVQLRAEVMGETPQGWRINFFVVHGEVHGPKLRGRIRPEGGDWMCIRSDGVGEVDIKITYETPDGALLLEQSGGVFDIGPQGYADVVRGIYRGAPPFFATPVYLTADPRWKWINALQCFGFGRVVMHELRVECDIYAPRLASAPGLG